jgi:uncharacterized membrane protein YdcZ (DUF606 family)
VHGLADRRAAAGFLHYHARRTNQRGIDARDGGRMLGGLTRTMVKVLIASMIVGTVLGHFGISTDKLLKSTGYSAERLEDLAQQGLAWALPNLLLGALVIIPVWFVVYLFRPPGESRD